MVIRELFAKLGIQVDEASFKAADAAVGAVKKGLVGIGAAVGAARIALAGMVKATADYASEVHDLSISTGLTAENLQVLGYVGKLAGSSMEEVAQGLMHLSRSAYEAANSGGAAGEAFYKLGINALDAAGKVKEPNQLLSEVAAALTKIQNPTERAAISMQLMGRSGARLTQTLSKFGGDLEAVKKEALSLGVVLDEKTIQAGDDLGDSLDRVNFAIKGVVYAIGTPLLARVRALAEGWVRWISVHRQWIALKVHEAIGHVNNAMEGLYMIGQKIVEHPTFLKWLLAVGAAAAAIMFPLTALTLLIAGIGEDLALFFKDPKSDTLTRSLIEGFKALGEEINKLGFFETLKVEATKFADWFAQTIIDAIGRAGMHSLFGAPLDLNLPKGAAPYKDPTPEQGWRNLFSNMGKELFGGTGLLDVRPDGQQGVTPGSSFWDFLKGNSTGYLATAAVPMLSGPMSAPMPRDAMSIIFSPNITVEAAPGVDGAKVGADIWDAIEPRADDWLSRRISAAQGATHR